MLDPWHHINKKVPGGSFLVVYIIDQKAASGDLNNEIFYNLIQDQSSSITSFLEDSN